MSVCIKYTEIDRFLFIVDIFKCVGAQTTYWRLNVFLFSLSYLTAFKKFFIQLYAIFHDALFEMSCQISIQN